MIPAMLLLCGFMVDFFYRKSEKFSGRNWLENPKIKTLSPKFADRFAEVPSTGSIVMNMIP